MAYTIDWEARVIHVPKSDLTHIDGIKYQFDLYEFAKECWRLLWEFDQGLSYPEIIRYYPAIDTGDVILARTILLINNYTVTFEDGQYAVLFKGANTNVHNFTNVNQVSIRPNNSAGLTESLSLDNIAESVWRYER